MTNYSIDSALLVQDPENWKHIAVIGVNVESMEPDLAALKKEFPSFKITLENRTDPFYTKQFANGNPVPVKVEKRTTGKLGESRWYKDAFGTMELLVTAIDKSRFDTRAKKSVYAVVSGHMVLGKKLCRLYIDNHHQFSLSYRQEVEGKASSASFFIHSKNEVAVFDLEHPPLLCYRYNFETTLEPSHNNPVDANLSQGMTITKCPTQECPTDIKDGECLKSLFRL